MSTPTSDTVNRRPLSTWAGLVDGPCQERSDERGEGEDDLTTRRADQSGAGDPHRDRQAVAQCPNCESGEDEPGDWRSVEHEAQSEVDRSGDHALGKK